MAAIAGILGRKLGMLQIFDRHGNVVPVTVIEAGPCQATQVKTPERDGYAAVQLGFGAARRANSPLRGHLRRLGPFRYLREFPVDEPSGFQVGQRVGVELFQPGQRVDVTGTSKGRGFAGVVKRHGFAGGPKTHGQSDRHRAAGSIGATTTPGRVVKGLRMAGHMGHQRVTLLNLEVVEVNPARGLLMVKGAVPGPNGGLLRIRHAVKAAKG
ncbi:MAG: 50S ribosomal protein L3 [Dehalococcoidia bacterium]